MGLGFVHLYKSKHPVREFIMLRLLFSTTKLEKPRAINTAMGLVKICYINFLEEIQQFLCLDGGELKSEILMDDKYRGIVVMPTYRERQTQIFKSAGHEDSITEAYESTAERAVHVLVVRHKLKVIDNFKTIKILEDKFREGKKKVIYLIRQNQDMVETVTEMSCEMEALAAWCSQLEEENKEVMEQLYQMSHLDKEFMEAQRRFEETLKTCTNGLEKEAAKLRSAIAKQVKF